MTTLAILVRNGTLKAALVFCAFLVLSVCYAPAQVHAAPSSTGKIEYNCDPEAAEGLGKDMKEAHEKGLQARVGAGQETFRQMKYKSSAGCIIKIMGYFDVIHKILTGTLSLIATAVLGLVTWLIGYVCNFVVQGINNLLASICLPIPNLGISMSLPSLESKSCDGLSLQNLISVSGGPIGAGGSLPSISLDSAVRQMMSRPR